MSGTNFAELIGQLNGGVFEQQVNAALSNVAANTCQHGSSGRGKPRKGRLVLEFTVEQIGESSQVTLSHKLRSEAPKPRGKAIEEHTTETPLHVGRGGALSLFPDAQGALDLGAGAATGRTDGVRA